MEKQEAKDLTKAIISLEKTLASSAKDFSLFSRKIDTLNENIARLNDKISTYIQIQQH